MIFDIWSVWHVIGAFVVGVLFSVALKRTRWVALAAIVIPTGWEVIEQNVLVSWTNLLEAEPLLNSAGDIAIGITFIMVGHLVYKWIMGKR